MSKLAKSISNGRTSFLAFLLVLAVIPLLSHTSALAQIDDGNAASGPITVDHVHGEVLVKFVSGISEPDQASIHAQLGVKVIRRIPAVNVQRVRGLQGQSTEALIAAYSQRPEIQYAEPNIKFRAIVTPDDPDFDNLWGLHNYGQTIIKPNGFTFTVKDDVDVDAPEAWDIQTGGSAVVVADIDSGVDYTHEDLADNIWTNPGEVPGNGIDDDGNGFVDDYHGWDFANNDNDPMDDNGHGTHTSGTLAAVGNNGIGVVGVNWQAKIMPVKFLSNNGSGRTDAAIEAILYASQMGAKVSNNSWGCGPSNGCFSQALEDAIEEANNRGMLFVVAAGNANNDNDNVISYPCTAAADNVICVAAIDYFDNRATFSSFGQSSVHLGAPGVEILSTVPKIGAGCCSDPSGYKFLNGTSMATPHVAGVAALVAADQPGLSIADIKKVILSTVDPVPALEGITVTGGRLNANSSLRSNFTISVVPDSQTIRHVGNASVRFTVSVSSLKGYSSPVTLNLVPPDATITGSFGNMVLTPPPDGTAETTLTVSTTQPGTEQVTVVGTDSLGETHSATFTLVAQGPDFSISVDPDTRGVVPGGSTSYNVTVTSIQRYSSPVTLSLVSTDPAISGAFTVNPVTPPQDGTATSVLNVSTTSALPFGAHNLTVIATDGIKTRRDTVSLVAAEVVGIDLVVTEVVPLSTTAASTAGTARVRVTTLNRGTDALPFDANGYPYGIYLSVDPVITRSDELIYLPSLPPAGLGPGESYTQTLSATVGGFLPEGDYYVGVITDWINKVREGDESNNTAVANDTLQVLNDSSDLVMTDILGPSTGIAGGPTGPVINIADTLLNQGIGQAASLSGPSCAGIFVGFYLSQDAVIVPGDDIVIGGRLTCVDLDPGATSSDTTSVTIPKSVAAGTYYLGAYADAGDSVIETDETNNGRTGNQITVITVPDITVNYLIGPASAATDTIVTLTDSVSNIGSGDAGSFEVGFYLSDDPIYDSGDVFLGSRSVTRLGVSATTAAATDVLIPSSTRPGTYYLFAVGDDQDTVVELDEGNNVKLGTSIDITKRRSGAPN